MNIKDLMNHRRFEIDHDYDGTQKCDACKRTESVVKFQVEDYIYFFCPTCIHQVVMILCGRATHKPYEFT
jgi:hypothetical protein